MKFEANLPSYLKFVAGSFPVGGKSTPKREKPTNFYEQAKQGFDMPMTNEENILVSGPKEVMKPKKDNFFETMQTNMQDKGPVIPSDEDPVNPFTPKPIGPVLPDRMARESAETDEYIG